MRFHSEGGLRDWRAVRRFRRFSQISFSIHNLTTNPDMSILSKLFAEKGRKYAEPSYPVMQALCEMPRAALDAGTDNAGNPVPVSSMRAMLFPSRGAESLAGASAPAPVAAAEGNINEGVVSAAAPVNFSGGGGDLTRSRGDAEMRAVERIVERQEMLQQIAELESDLEAARNLYREACAQRDAAMEDAQAQRVRADGIKQGEDYLKYQRDQARRETEEVVKNQAARLDQVEAENRALSDWIAELEAAASAAPVRGRFASKSKRGAGAAA